MTTQRQPVHVPPVLVVGAGVGGLAAAVVLAAAGRPVQILERAARPGGKLVPCALAGRQLDAGPTVLTLREVFDALFALAGERLEDHLPLQPLATLARHAWSDGSRLDLHADLAQSVDAMGAFAGARAAREYAAFCARTQALYEALDGPYLRGPRPGPLSLTWRCARDGPRALWGLVRGRPMRAMWGELATQFSDPRLRQLFGRYATYAGSSPYLAPATLMLIAHVERRGVWSVDGGLHGLADALVALAQRLGATVRCHSEVRRLLVQGGRACGVELADGERLAAEAVVFNGDTAALAAGLLGPEAQAAVPPQPVAGRALSALTWNLVAPVRGFDLARHTVFFGDDYAAEFDDLFRRRRLPQDPTVYLCAQDRERAAGPPEPGTPERLLVLVNAPADGDHRPPTDEEIAACETHTFARLQRLGLQIERSPSASACQGPAQWAQRFPATGGGLYGQATHGWRSAFSRPASHTRLPGLLLAGGSTHPGAGVPMAALSGWLAAQACLDGLAPKTGPGSMPRWRPAATPGGTSTR